MLSAAASARAVIPIAKDYDAFLVACFSAHPLIPALREELSGPVIGIMEAALYSARMLGNRLGVLTTGARSAILHNDSIAMYGLSQYSAGTQSSGLGVLELERLDREMVLGKVGEAATRLVAQGADCIALGCAGMTDMKIRCEDVVGANGEVQIIDGVGVGVHLLIALVREGHKTAKAGSYASSRVTREARGQDWI